MVSNRLLSFVSKKRQLQIGKWTLTSLDRQSEMSWGSISVFLSWLKQAGM